MRKSILILLLIGLNFIAIGVPPANEGNNNAKEFNSALNY